MSGMFQIVGPGLDAPSGELMHRNIENPNTPITPDVMQALVGFGDTVGRRAVTPKNALRISTVFACVRILAFAVSRMRCHVYKTKDGKGRARAVDHPLYDLLRVRPNKEVQAAMFRQSLIANMLLWGNAYAEIVRNPRRGTVESLHIIESHRVRPRRLPDENDTLVYDVSTKSGLVTLGSDEILHIPYLSLDGIIGLSPIAYARASLAAGINADEFFESFMSKSMRPGGVVKHPRKLDAPAQSRLRESTQAVYGGAANAGNILILEEGAEYQQLTMPLADAQFVESQNFRVEDICRWFGVPPHKVGHLARATYANIEHQDLQFLFDSLAPLIEIIEGEMLYKLLTADERREYFIEHDARRVVAMASKEHADVQTTQIRAGIKNTDEARAELNLDELPEGRGTVHFTQSSNMPLPTPAQADALVEKWGSASKSPGTPSDQTDGKSSSTDDSSAAPDA